MNTNNNNIIKNESININIDKRIIPLFSTPVYLKKLSDKKRNKYNFNLKNLHKKLNFKIITLNEILDLFLKGLNNYNVHLIKYFKKHNNLQLILQLKAVDYYKLNIYIANYFYIINKFIPVFKLRSLLYNTRLFLPNQLLKPEPYIKFNYRLRYIAKIYLEHLDSDKRNRKINRRQINKVLNKGNEIIYEINNQINHKQKLIQKLKDKNLKFNNVSMLPPKINKQIIKNNVNTNILNIFSNVHINKKLLLNKNKIFINKLFNSFKVNKLNEIKIIQTMNSILKYKSFNCQTEPISIYSNPVAIIYSNFINNLNLNLYNNININNNNFYKYKYNNNVKNKINNNNNNKNNNNNNNNNKNKPIINQYLKSLSSYNLTRKGILMYYTNIIGFNFNTETNKLIKNIYKLLAGSFKSMYCLISKPVFIMTPDKIIIQLFYYLFIPNILKFKKIHKYSNINNSYSYLNKKLRFKRTKRIKKQYRKFRKIKINIRIKLRKLSNISLTKVFKVKFKKLCDILSHLFKKPVQLDLIRLHYPYNDSNILVNLLGIMINKIKLRIILRKLYEKAVIKNLNKLTGKTNIKILPAFLTGINIKVAGRLLTQRVIPRKTVKNIRRGAVAKGKINFSDIARYTNKNKRGSFSITVSSGHNLF